MKEGKVVANLKVSVAIREGTCTYLLAHIVSDLVKIFRRKEGLGRELGQPLSVHYVVVKGENGFNVGPIAVLGRDSSASI